MGLVDCVVELRTLDHAVHSGMWGGLVPDALTAMCRLLATPARRRRATSPSRVWCPGKAADLDYPLDRVEAESGLLAGVELLGSGSVVDRIWTKPALAVLAIDATRVADASNTLIPVAPRQGERPGRTGRRRPAGARTPPCATSRRTPRGVRSVTVIDGDLGEPFAIDASGPAYDAARNAFRDAWSGTAPVDIGVGGSIPFIAEFAQAFPDAAILVTGVEDPDTRAHGANEGLHLAEFERVCLAEALLLTNLANLT